MRMAPSLQRAKRSALNSLLVSGVPGQAQGDEVGLGQLLVQLALGHHTQAVVRAGRVGVDRAADAQPPQRPAYGRGGAKLEPMSPMPTQSTRAPVMPSRGGRWSPLALVLAVAVEEHILLDAQPHGQHPLADGQTVGTGGRWSPCSFRAGRRASDRRRGRRELDWNHSMCLFWLIIDTGALPSTMSAQSTHLRRGHRPVR